MEREIIDADEIQGTQFKYVDFLIRLGAFIIDMVIVAVLYSIVFGFIGTSVASTSPLIIGPLIIGLFISISLLYHAGFESSALQATPGKLALSLYIGDDNGRRISFTRAAKRYFAKYLSTIVLFFGYFMIIWDPKHQALHDRLTGTYVIHK